MIRTVFQKLLIRFAFPISTNPISTNISTNNGAAGIIGNPLHTPTIENVYTYTTSDNLEKFSNFVRTCNSLILTNAYYLSTGTNYVGRNFSTTYYKNVQARTESQLKVASNFTGFDFDNIWEIDEGVSYPTFKNFKVLYLDDILVDENDVNLLVSDNDYDISVEYIPRNAIDRGVTFESSDEDVAVVNSLGKVTIKKSGNVTITVKSIKNNNIVKEVVINIYDEALKIDEYDLVNDRYIMSNTLLSREELLGNIATISDSYSYTLSSDGDRIGTGNKISIYKGDTLIDTYVITLLGDITGSGVINISDVAKLYQYINNKIDMDYEYKIAGDVVHDDELKINDVAKLYQYISGKFNSLEE